MNDINYSVFKVSLNPFSYKTKLFNNKSYRINPIKETYIKENQIKSYLKSKEEKLKNLQKFDNSDESDESIDNEFPENDKSFEDIEQTGTENTNNDKVNLEKLDSDIKPLKRDITQFTHYLCVPLKSKQLIDKFSYFKKTVIEEGFSNIESELFQKEDNLHVTILCLKINQSELNKIINIINNAIKENSTKLLLDLSMVEFMPYKKTNKAKNIYVTPLKGDSLEAFKDFVDNIIKDLVTSGLVCPQTLEDSHIIYNKENDRYENNIIHCTLMNKNFANKQPFDGQKICKKLKHFSGLGIEELSTIELRPLGKEGEIIKFNI